MIGKKIKQIRRQKGLTLTELAERAGIAKSNLSNIERNVNQNPSIQVMEKIAEVLGVDVRSLLSSSKRVKSQELDEEWVKFIYELQETGIEKEEIQKYKTLIEFIKWKNEQSEE
ncbi:transcriptional regulator [Bacillus sp. J14TS2]|uniref:helix-turn-helix domain-containing protein n=1 Tax=Bacillus sp. J14TS2 TaxID=2807188 RepID=UPI001B2ABBF1|nr:helix-turn-helix transcriptional regulator [Bacillus sp. J14TS2]GIN73218.1 transcriptional regulator [Bacillus sp. J14TS2]